MPQRDKGKLIPLRKDVPWRVYDVIANRHVLHIDAWFVQDGDDQLYFIIQTRAGGWDVVSSDVFRATPGVLQRVTVPAGELLQRGLLRHVDNPWSRRHAPWANALHWRYIVPQLHIPREGFKRFMSVRLHYVYSNPAVSDPCEGLYNGYGATARAARFGDNLRPNVPPPEDATPRLSARERSIMRTLQKLLD